MSKNSLSMAYAMKKRSKKKMANGGHVEADTMKDLMMDRREVDTSFAKEQNRDEDADRFEGEEEIASYAHGGEVESIVDAIMAKREQSRMGKLDGEHEPMEGAGEFYDAINEEAAMKENMQEMHEHDHDLHTNDVVDSIMRKRKRKV
jgi:hypothetical protein